MPAPAGAVVDSGGGGHRSGVATTKTEQQHQDRHDDPKAGPLARPHERSPSGATAAAERAHLTRLAALAYYACASMGAQYFVKFLFTGYGFTFPLSVALLQVVCTVPAAYITMGDKVDWATAVKCLPLAIVHTLNVTAALAGTCGLSLPMLIALRRFCLLFTIALEWCLLGRVHKKAAVGSTGLMILGALLAAVTDLNFNAAGYAAIAANNLMTALYLVMMKQPTLSSLGSKVMLFYSAALSVPLLGAAVVLFGESTRVAAFAGAAAPGFSVVLGLAGCMGVFINHATMVCTRVNGPLTTNVVGSAKNIVMTAIGMLAFGDFLYAPWNMAGLVVSTAGTVWYAASEFRGMRRRAAASLSAVGGPGEGEGSASGKTPLINI